MFDAKQTSLYIEVQFILAEPLYGQNYAQMKSSSLQHLHSKICIIQVS